MATTINTINVGGVDKYIEDTEGREFTAREATRLDNRIDNIIGGDAPSAAEVVDARVGVDETVYNTLGNAIRGQITNTNTSIVDKNIIGSITKIKNYAIGSDGVVFALSHIDVSDYIEIPDDVDVITLLDKFTNAGTAYKFDTIFVAFDSNKNVIEAVTGHKIGVASFILDKKWKYLRINFSGASAEASSLICKFSHCLKKDEVVDVLPYANILPGWYIGDDKATHESDFLSMSSYIPIDGVYSIRFFDDFDGVIWDCKGAYYDKNKQMIGVIPKGTILGDREFIIPTDEAKYIVINTPTNRVVHPDYLYLNYKPDENMVSGAMSGIQFNMKSSKENLYSFVSSENFTYGHYIDSDGTIGTHGLLGYTDYIKLDDVVSLTLNNSFTSNNVLVAYDCKGAFYDVNKAFIEPIVSSFKGNIIVAVPSNAKYLRFNIINFANHPECDDKNSEVLYFVKRFPEWLNSLSEKWTGKKGVFLGDSITEGTSTTGVTKPWVTSVAEKLGLGSFVNYGIGGTTIAGANDPDAFVNRYTSMTNDADLVVVMGGTNDALYGAGGITLGSAADIGSNNKNSFYGALDILTKGLSQKYPSATIVFMTPLHYYDQNGSPTHNEKNTDAQMDAWAEAIQVVCKRNGIPCIDFRNIMNLNPNIDSVRNTYFQDKWVHPNQNGHNLIAERLYKNFDLF